VKSEEQWLQLLERIFKFLAESESLRRAVKPQ